MIIFNFDVLARPGTDLAARLPDPDGNRLWRMMHEHSMGRLAVVVDEDVDTFIFEHWLKMNNIKAAIYEVLDTTDPQMKADKIHRLSMSVGRSDWYLDNDPLTCAITLKLGIPTLLVAAPYVVRPEWVGTKSSRSWDTLVAEVDRQVALQAEKTWGRYNPDNGDDE